MLQGRTYLNNSIVAINDIGEGADALLCMTDNTDCCKPPNGLLQGEFYYPNNNLVNNQASGNALYRNRGPQVIRLNRRSGSVPALTGIYRCDIPDSRGKMQNMYINVTGEYSGFTIYSNNKNCDV